MAKESEKTEKAKKEKKRPMLGFRKKEKTVKETARAPVANPYDVLRFVLMTEKSVRMIEAENKLVFVVSRRAKQKDIKSAFEAAFESPVSNITTNIDQKGRKKAFIKMKNAGAAGEIAIRLGII